jgi:hypothetical protein
MEIKNIRMFPVIHTDFTFDIYKDNNNNNNNNNNVINNE